MSIWDNLKRVFQQDDINDIKNSILQSNISEINTTTDCGRFNNAITPLLWLLWKMGEIDRPKDNSVFTKSRELLQFLVDNGANVDVNEAPSPTNPNQLSYHESALNFAIDTGDPDTVSILLQKLTKNKINNLGSLTVGRQTPLMRATINYQNYAENGHIVYADKCVQFKIIIEQLIDKGATLNSKTGVSPLTYVIVVNEKGMDVLIPLFLEKGKKEWGSLEKYIESTKTNIMIHYRSTRLCQELDEKVKPFVDSYNASKLGERESLHTSHLVMNRRKIPYDIFRNEINPSATEPEGKHWQPRNRTRSKGGQHKKKRKTRRRKT